MTNMRHRAKFHADRSNYCGDMAVFRFFKMAAVRHLGFLKARNFNCPYPSDGQHASSSQILCRSVKPLRRYGHFSTLQDGGRPPSWICYTPIWTIHEVYFRGLGYCAKCGLNRCSSFWQYASFNIFSVELENAYSRPFWGCLGVKIGENGNVLWFYQSRNAITLDWHPMNQTA